MGQCVTWDDVRIDETDDAYRYRREMEARYGQDVPSIGAHPP